MRRKAHKIASTRFRPPGFVRLALPVASFAVLQQSLARQGEHAATGDEVAQMHADAWHKDARPEQHDGGGWQATRKRKRTSGASFE